MRMKLTTTPALKACQMSRYMMKELGAIICVYKYLFMEILK
jgi:hypothetical protein